MNNMRKNKKIFISIFLIFVLLTLIILKSTEIEAEKNKISTIKPKIENLIKKEHITGELIPLKEIQVKSQVSGILKRVFVNTNDKVEIGDKLALIEIIANPSNLESARKNKEISFIRLSDGKRNLDRNKTLFNKGVISRLEYENAVKNYSIIKEEFESSEELYHITKNGFSTKQLVTNIVKSTANGTVIELPEKEGASITERNNFNEGSTIALIAEMDSFIFKSKINERDVPYIKDSTKFEISVNAIDDLKLTGVLKQISSKGWRENGITKFELEAKIIDSLESQEIKIRSGFSAIAEFIVKKKENVLAVEEKNLVFKNGVIGVEILDQNNSVIWKPVKTGISNGFKIEIIDGLTQESKIVIK